MKDITTGLSKLMEYADENRIMYTLEASLKRFTTFKIGGKCRCAVFISSDKNCCDMLDICKEYEVPYIILGKGSNVLISDDGFNGIAFIFGKAFSDIKVNENTIICEAGCPLARVAYVAYQHSLTGFEFAWGIPGSVGGAVVMNAGAYGGEIKDIISSAEYIDDDGNICTATTAQLDLSYRHSIFSRNDYVVTRAVFKLEKGNKTEIRAKMDDLMNRRKTKQPLEYASAGSTFKRPEGTYAALLIEQCGLKGYSIGDAQVSKKHSGFVINKGNACFDDVMTLINDVKRIVKDKSGYDLECEIRIIADR